MFSEPVTPPVVAIMWGSLSQDIPTFWQCGSICTWTPHFYRRAAAANRLWWPNVYSCWSCYVTIRIIKSFMVQLYVRPAYMSCHSGDSLAGFKLPFPCTRIWARCGLALVALKRTGCDVWQMDCQASNVTANVQSDHLLHGDMFQAFFTTEQLHGPPCSAEIQPMSQHDAVVPQLVRIVNWYSIHVKNEKDEKFVQFLQGIWATFFWCSG